MVPHGGALAVSLLACTTLGAVVGVLRFDVGVEGWSAITLALCAAQVLGHASLATAGHHHGGAAANLTPSMAAAHVGVAAVLGLAIAAAEHLYVVCCSVVSWLRLFAMRAARPVARAARGSVNIVVVQHIFVACLGMRAPPPGFATA